MREYKYMQRIEANQRPMIQDNPENNLQLVPARRYFTFFIRQAIELLAAGVGVAALGIAIKSQRTVSEQSKVIEDLQYRLSNLELDLKQEQLVFKKNILYQHSQTGSCLQMEKLLNDLNEAIIAGDKSIKNTLLFTNKQILKSISIDKKQTLSSALIRVLNAFEKIELAKEGKTVTVDSVEEAREIAEQGGMAEVAKTVSIEDKNSCHNIAKSDPEAYRSIINRYYG